MAYADNSSLTATPSHGWSSWARIWSGLSTANAQIAYAMALAAADLLAESNQSDTIRNAE